MSGREDAGQQGWGRETARDDDREFVEQPVARDVTSVIDPKDDFINMLSDFGIKTKKVTMATIFFSGDIDDPEWMDRVLKEGGIDMARRRLAIMRWYGSTPEELRMQIKPGPTEKRPMGKGKKSVEEETEDDIDKLYKEMKLQEIRELKEEVQERKLKAMKKKLSGDDDDKADKKEKSSSDEVLIEIPLTDPNTGQVVLDKENRPVMMKITPQQYFYMQQNQLMAQGKGKKSDEPSLWEKQLMEDAKYYRELSMKLLTKDDGDKYLKLVLQQSDEREKFLKGVYDLREQILRKEVKELGDAIKGPDEWYKTILHYTGLAQKMGIVQGDPKQMIQQQVTAQMLDRMNDMQMDGRLLLQEAINMMRVQQQRQIQGGAPGPGQIEAQRPLSEQEKQYFYLKGAEDYKKAVEAQASGQQPPAPQQPAAPPTTEVPPPPPAPVPPPKPAPEQPPPQEPVQPPKAVEESGGYEVQLRPDEAEVPPPPIEVHIPERPAVDVSKKSAGVAEQQVQRWSSESPIDDILTHPLDEDPEKKTKRWSQSE